MSTWCSNKPYNAVTMIQFNDVHDICSPFSVSVQNSIDAGSSSIQVILDLNLRDISVQVTSIVCPRSLDPFYKVILIITIGKNFQDI